MMVYWKEKAGAKFGKYCSSRNKKKKWWLQSKVSPTSILEKMK